MFKAVNYKEKSTPNFRESRETCCTFYSETDNLKSILLKAALQKVGRREGKQNTKWAHSQMMEISGGEGEVMVFSAKRWDRRNS